MEELKELRHLRFGGVKELRHLRFGGVKELKELSLPAVAEELRQQLFFLYFKQ